MAIHIENSRYHLDNSEAKIQSLPFKIHADCESNVKKYFETSVKPESEGVEKASFRGYPLKGTTLNFPKGYIGIVLHESIAPVTDKEERKFHVINKFNSMKYWNWDVIPSKNDKIVQALDWIDIAEALHSPILEE